MTSPSFQTRSLPETVDEAAPDGSQIRRLCRTDRSSLVHVTLPAGGVTRAVAHTSVEELWYVLAGQGELWRALGEEESVVRMDPGVAISLPVGTAFQLRCLSLEPLEVLCVTSPPWPGVEEARFVTGPWTPVL